MFRPTAVRALGVAALIVVATGVTGCLDSVITEHGSGDLETRDYEVGEFTSIEAHRALRVNVTVDPNVIGGIQVRVGDEVIDGTLATRIEQARRRLTS